MIRLCLYLLELIFKISQYFPDNFFGQLEAHFLVANIYVVLFLRIFKYVREWIRI